MDLSTHRVSPVINNLLVFGVCNGLVTLGGPLAVTVLYPQ